MMINYYYESEFALKDEDKYTNWIKRIVNSENKKLGELSYIFCSDDYLFELNEKYLGHSTFTDIITFDYSENENLSGEVYISIDRVIENAEEYKEEFERELLRVMAHGILHLAGYNDKEDKERKSMRVKENEKIEMFHVKQ
jgi:probable rRNA maturation factor